MSANAYKRAVEEMEGNIARTIVSLPFALAISQDLELRDSERAEG